MTKTVTFSFDDPDLVPQQSKAFRDQLASMIQGAVKDKQFSVSPGLGWEVTTEEEGVYKITHPLATHFYSLSVSLLKREAGSIEVLEAGNPYIRVKTYDLDKNPMFKDFRFALSVLIHVPMEGASA